MSYIAPNTTIKLLHNCPLDNSYDHTLYFESKTEQYNYFNSLSKYMFSEQSYQRVQRGRIRLQVLSDNIYDCNYLMFQNTSFGSKWFYAFITSVEYISNVVSEIEFEIDVLQTWFFDYSVEKCFVEREHSISDIVGYHIEPENVEIGEYIFNDYSEISTSLKELAVAIMIVDDDEVGTGTLFNGVYGGCALYLYRSDDVASISKKLKEYVQKPEAIVAMYMLPSLAYGISLPDNGALVTYSEHSTNLTISKTKITGEESLDGYKPKNKKLYTYPYNFYHVDNANGDGMVLRYEFFNSLTPSFRLTIPVTMPIQCMLRPINYKGTGNTGTLTETLTLSGYPMCAWSTDAFKAWLAQNSVPLIGKAVATTSSVLTGNPFLVAGGIRQVESTLSSAYKSAISADISKGNLSNGNGNVGANTQAFFGGRCSITAEYAKIIDDYFNMFGYATKRCKEPNRNSRPHWNYVKTLGCVITGSVPSQDSNKICSIYNNGITFWKHGNEVGDYSLDNSPVEQGA